MKTCNDCATVKPLECFYENSRGTLAAKCKECVKRDRQLKETHTRGIAERERLREQAAFTKTINSFFPAWIIGAPASGHYWGSLGKKAKQKGEACEHAAEGLGS